MQTSVYIITFLKTVIPVKKQKNITQRREKPVDKNKVANEADTEISQRKH